MTLKRTGRSATNCLVQTDKRRESISAQLDQRQLDGQQCPLCVKLFDIGYVTSAIPIAGMPKNIANRSVLRKRR